MGENSTGIIRELIYHEITNLAMMSVFIGLT